MIPRGQLDPAKAKASEMEGEKLFFGNCSTCHPATSYPDSQMHDLHVEAIWAQDNSVAIKKQRNRGVAYAREAIRRGPAPIAARRH